jgi:hypothetical protein
MKNFTIISIFFVLLPISSLFSQQLILNEVSQGPSGSKEYVEFLVFIYQSGVYDAISKSKAHAQLLSIQKSLTAVLPSSTKNSKEHRNFILSSIKSALDSK